MINDSISEFLNGGDNLELVELVPSDLELYVTGVILACTLVLYFLISVYYHLVWAYGVIRGQPIEWFLEQLDVWFELFNWIMDPEFEENVREEEDDE